jgi:outer membrane protein TolC
MMLRLSRWCIALLGLGSWGLAQAQPPFPLSEALGRLERAPEVLLAQQRLRQVEAELRLAQAQAGLRLDLGGSASYTLNSSNPPLGTSVSLNLNLPGGDSPQMIAVQQAALAVEAARATLRQTTGDLARRVVQGYGQVLQAESQRAQGGLLLELAQRQAAVVEAQQRLGAATGTQVLNARLSASTAQQNFNRSESELRDRNATLAALLGLVALPGRPVLPNLPTLPTFEQLHAHLGQSPAVVQAEVALEQAGLAVRRAGGLSGFSMSLGMTSDQVDASLGVGIPDLSTQAVLTVRPTVANFNQSITVTLGASVPLWDGGVGQATRQSVLLALESARTQAEQTRRDSGRSLEGVLAQAALDSQALAVQQEAASVAEKSLAETQQRLALGALTPLDELAARANLEATHGALLAAQMRYLEDIYQLYALLGVGGL